MSACVELSNSVVLGRCQKFLCRRMSTWFFPTPLLRPLKIAEKVWSRHVVTAAENEYCQSKLYSSRNSQPAEVPEKTCDVLLCVTDQLEITWGVMLTVQRTLRISIKWTSIQHWSCFGSVSQQRVNIVARDRCRASRVMLRTSWGTRCTLSRTSLTSTTLTSVHPLFVTGFDLFPQSDPSL